MSLWAWVTGYDSENAARAAAADAEIRSINEQKRASGYYTESQWREVERDFETDAFLSEDAAQREIDRAFGEGAKEGLANVTGTVKSGINNLVGRPLLAVLSGIPLWVWLIGALYVAWSLGWLTWLFRAMRKK